ncbi:MAG: TatD family hydrolase [Candidatus Peregrinibacteria bacterium]|nr:TatD family hydrolase [Candidatus Peregrinibacteria bacterium]
MLIDTHAHIMFPEFDEDREEVIQRAMDAGLERIICVGCGAGSSEAAVKMAQEDESGFLYATVGLHPYDAMEVSDELMARWEKWILADKDAAEESGGARKIIAIGETGLDYFKSKVDPEKQKYSFKKHLELAVKMGLPVIVHNRSADEDCLNLLKEFSRDGGGYKKLIRDCGCEENDMAPVKAVFHCYGSTLEFARKVWAAGFMTSFTGIITYPSAKDLREVVKEVPLDKFMVETDCPYLAPQGNRGKRNEPSYVVETAEKIAEIKGMGLSDVEKQVMENTKKFFGF